MGALGNGPPELPPEWGEITIPDDPSELDQEAAGVRKELRAEARRARLNRWRQRLHLPPHIDDPEEPSLFLPMLVLGIALLVTLLSLLMIVWPSLDRSTPEQIDPGPPVIQPT